VNWSEVIQKTLEKKTKKTAHLRAETRSAGLSLGDRACLALAGDLGRPALTADKVWRDLPRVEVRVVR
jgi:PIN domain nuclease of toxin-antitoxin system